MDREQIWLVTNLSPLPRSVFGMALILLAVNLSFRVSIHRAPDCLIDACSLAYISHDLYSHISCKTHHKVHMGQFVLNVM